MRSARARIAGALTLLAAVTAATAAHAGPETALREYASGQIKRHRTPTGPTKGSS